MSPSASFFWELFLYLILYLFLGVVPIPYTVLLDNCECGTYSQVTLEGSNAYITVVQVIVQEREHSKYSHEASFTGSEDKLTTLK